MSGGCRDLCLRYKKSPRFDSGNSRYCQNCELFLEYDGFICPCCSSKLRHKPRTARRARSYYERNPDKMPKRIE